MATVKIDSGDFPTAEGAIGGNLDRVINKWRYKVAGGFREGAEWFLKAIEETDRLELWKVYGKGFYGTREEFIEAKILGDFQVVEETIPAIVERLKAGESVNLERANGDQVEFVPTLNHNGVNRFTSDRPDNNEIIRSTEQDYGTSSTYRIAKLKRDAPEFAARLEAGEFSNVREAERAAGFPVPPKLSTLERAYRAVMRLNESDRAKLATMLNGGP